jgi:outer membrane lipoprotein LolB
MQLRVESADGSPDAPPAQSLSAQFELRGHSTAGELDLSSPLGSVLARAHWSPKEVWLETPKEGRIFYPDVLALSEQALGQALPLEALFDWIAGRPWPMTDSQVLDAAQEEAHAGLTGFRQLGWQVDLSQRAKGRLIFERRDPLPRVRVRLQLDDVPAAAPESAGKP